MPGAKRRARTAVPSTGRNRKSRLFCAHRCPMPRTALTSSWRQSIVIPPPNVTGSLHMGHALNNTLQDILMPPEAHAGL
jgi:valyl-tRNA synthetase